MTDAVEPLVLDLVEWIARAPRPCAEVLDAWRTSCPRLPVWEEAVERGLVAQRIGAGRGAMVAVTEAGFAFLRAHGRGDAPTRMSNAAAAL